MSLSPLMTAEFADTEFLFSTSLTRYSRFLTQEVTIGNVPMGGNNPIRIQSMTTTDTMDTMGTVAQAMRMADAGCEYIRITAPSVKEAENLAVIKKELHKRGYFQPLVADIHFTPNAAELAARLVEKVRINPGNYADRKNFKEFVYSPSSYDAELERIRKKFIPLVRICKEYGTAMRIGTNHGSLSDRIMSYYGDTPRGMVESAMEFIRICTGEGFYNLVISMKSSNPTVMVQAYRLLVHTMAAEGYNFPLHLGVTEAGDGEDGRIKSALGIGTLLEDGLGDTIRVSLTEEPEFEIPVAFALASRYELRKVATENGKAEPKLYFPVQPFYPVSPFEYSRRVSVETAGVGGPATPRVIGTLESPNLRNPSVLAPFGYHYSAELDKYHIDDVAADFIYFGSTVPSFQLPGTLKPIYDFATWKSLGALHSFPFLSAAQYLNHAVKWEGLHFIHALPETLSEALMQALECDQTAVLVLESSEEQVMSSFRQVYFELLHRNLRTPVVLKRMYPAEAGSVLCASADLGSLFLDGFGDGIWTNSISTAFGILQASRTRISKTEYISCPSCGRTLFDLMEVTQLIRSQTSHLKGIKIAIMGCIVNGPGEMADADYGYVGAGPGKITLYRGKTVVRKNVDSDKAVYQLIEIIQEDGKWVDLQQELA